jgi:hypothetical protein
MSHESQETIPEQSSETRKGIELSEEEKEQIIQRTAEIDQRIEEIKSIRTDEDKWNKLEDVEAQALFDEYTKIKDEKERLQRKLEGKTGETIITPEELNEKVVDTLKELLEQGADKDYIAQGLAGVSTDEAMQLRKELLEQGANKDSIAWGLAGVSTDEAMQLRKKLLKQGANKDYIARGLAGVSTDEAMQLRKKLLKQGANKDYIAWGLAGVSTDEAMQFRKENFSKDPTLFARSFSGNNTFINGVVCRYNNQE